MSHFFMYCPESYCTCKPTCDDICRGDCGCFMCRKAMAPYDDELGPDPEPCEACGRPWGDHRDDCEVLGGSLNFAKASKQRVKQRIKELKDQLAIYEGIDDDESGQLSLFGEA
jgi:hypothetical protein